MSLNGNHWWFNLFNVFEYRLRPPWFFAFCSIFPLSSQIHFGVSQPSVLDSRRIVTVLAFSARGSRPLLRRSSFGD